MPGVEGFMYPNEVIAPVERADRSVSIYHGAGGGRVHSGVAGARLPRGGGQADVSAGAAHGAGVSAWSRRCRCNCIWAIPSARRRCTLTPHSSSAMAMFGFVYLWYLMAVLVLEIWLDFRARHRAAVAIQHGLEALDLQSHDARLRATSARAPWPSTRRVGWMVTLIGIPSAFLLHGYVGFIFGSIKANPWWSSPLMPVVFIFSAMVSGIAAVMLLYMADHALRAQARSTCAAWTPSRCTCSTSSSSTSAWRCST